MTLPLTVAAVTLFYLGAVPIRFAFHLKLDGQLQFGAGIALFEPRYAFRHAMSPSRRRPLPPSLTKKENFPLLVRTGMRILRHLLGHLMPEGIRLDGILSTSDAAATALICGSASALGHTLDAFSGNRIRLNLRPDFSSDHLRAELSGMISVRAGHIMLAALLGVREYGTGRFKSWKNIPSKA